MTAKHRVGDSWLMPFDTGSWLGCPHATEADRGSPLDVEIKSKMSKIEKKKKKLQAKIDEMQEELRVSLTKKTSSTAEINVASHQRKIKDLQTKLDNL